ncbi:SnoaL-like polyketide cyclase [Falsiruegeria litorea R37]|uniref:SnoaL-like polyketide cyclase n=1 Tax=Falsiruegeria litorea R37 TaxID=1200284 RepID=A0A1Y5SHN4_9RHOB|nr:ester cyclase [Falsiruegeria litorea]SLN39362.1 SnoaL-like polyketide cyclase [Falsiruegeria litorea R37]
MTKSELLKEWYDRVWVHGDLEAIDQFFDPDTMAEGIIPEMQVGVDDFRDLVTAFRFHVGDIDVKLPKTVENGDWVAAMLHVHTSRADNGAPIEVTGQVMARFKDDKVVEAYNQFDFISLFEQLGQLPEDTLPICMTGQQLSWA